MNTPKTNTEEVLYTLIQQGNVSIFNFPYMSGFRTRVSDLRIKYNLPIQTKLCKQINKFGREYNYAVHYLKDTEIAIRLYNELNSKITK